jgi:hypothetical protein
MSMTIASFNQPVHVAIPPASQVIVPPASEVGGSAT